MGRSWGGKPKPIAKKIRECHDKCLYWTRRDAEQNIPPTQRVYRCVQCHGWHRATVRQRPSR